MGPTQNLSPAVGAKQAGQTEAEYASEYRSQFDQGVGHTSDEALLRNIMSPEAAHAFAYLNDENNHSDQNAQDLQLYQKAMLDHQMMMRQNPGRQGTILTGDALTPTNNFNPTSIL